MAGLQSSVVVKAAPRVESQDGTLISQTTCREHGGDVSLQRLLCRFAACLSPQVGDVMPGTENFDDIRLRATSSRMALHTACHNSRNTLALTAVQGTDRG